MNGTLNSRTIGLFGTCGGSKWRVEFMTAYAALGINFFNPQVENWTPGCADVEAWHLANDRLILFPVTSETFGFGSLAEVGFSIQSALSVNTNRFVVLYIEPDVVESLKVTNPAEAKASRSARALALAHLSKVSNPNVFIATSMKDMLEKSLKLYAALELLDSVRAPAADWRSTMPPQVWLKLISSEKSLEVEAAAEII